MSFNSICTQLQACLGSASIFPNGIQHVEIADNKVYSLGLTPVAVIDVNPRLRHIRESFGGGHLHEWHMQIKVGAQWRDADTSALALGAAWQGVLDQLCQHPFLGLGGQAGIRDAVVEGANLQPIVMEYGSVKFANVQLSLVVQEEADIAEAE